MTGIVGFPGIWYENLLCSMSGKRVEQCPSVSPWAARKGCPGRLKLGTKLNRTRGDGGRVF